MRMPRLRFTISRMLAGVALTAVLIWGCQRFSIWLGKRPFYLRQAALHQKREDFAREISASEEKRAKKNRKDSEWEREKELYDTASDSERFADQHQAWSVYAAEQSEREATLRRKWEQAALMPWKFPDPDPVYPRHRWIEDNLVLPDPAQLPQGLGLRP